MTSQGASCPQRSTATFLETKMLKTYQELREGLPKPGQPAESNPEKLKELQFQAFLRLEVESMCSGVDQIDPTERQESHDQVVELLRALLLGLGPKPVLEFLNTRVLSNYRSTLPQLLVTLYDELMQPLPTELREGGTPRRLASVRPQSVVGVDEASLSVGSSNLSSVSPRRRTRSSVHAHPALPRIDSKRQIQVNAPPARKIKGSNGKKGSKGKSKREKSRSPAKQKGAKKTRRNLFDTDLCKVPSKKEHGQASKSSRKKHSSSSTKQKTRHKTFVAETPHHRQKGRMSWQREREEQQAGTSGTSGPPDVEVIQESPFKDAEPHKTTPGRYKAPRRVLRRSFYSTASGHSSRSLSRALEDPSNISGRHHVAHLEASKGGQLAEALSREEGAASPRRRVTALLNPRSSTGASPHLQSPAHNTRSRTPQRSSRPPLLQDTRSMPAFPSAAKILDFTSPVKPSATMTSTSQTHATPPRAFRSRRTLLTDDSVPQRSEDAGHRTPTKVRGEASHASPPAKSQPSKRSQGNCTPKKEKVAGDPDLKRGELSTPRKRGRGQDEGRRQKGVSPQGSGVSGPQQSSILDYISPSRISPSRGPSASRDGRYASPQASTSGPSTPTRLIRAGRGRGGCGAVSSSTTSLPSHACDAKDTVDMQPRPGPSYTATPTKTQRVLLSPVRTPTKTTLQSPSAYGQQFLSPIKTPSKSILKNSPMHHGSSAQGGMSTTPQKSPRVTFRVQAASPRCREGEVKSPDSVMSTWPRKKRGWSGDAGKPSSSPGACDRRLPSQHAQPAGGGPDLRSSHSPAGRDVGVARSLEGSRLESSQGFVTAGQGQPVTPRKRRSVASDAGSFSSPPGKRQKTDSSVRTGISRPTLFSENAMDSYFSGSTDDVFLGASSTQLQPPSSPTTEQSTKDDSSCRPVSPLFKGRKHGSETAGKADSCRVFDFAANQSSFDSVGGSQGFEVVVSGSGLRPPSPTFNTSPVTKHQRGKGPRGQSRLGDSGWSEVRTGMQDALPPTVDKQQHRENLSPGQAGGSCAGRGRGPPASAEGSPGRLHSTVAPLRGKGVETERKYSPTVSTSSLTQLMRSPLILGSSRERCAQEGEQDSSSQSPPRKKSRKKLVM